MVRERQSQGRVKSGKFLKGTATNSSAAMLAKSRGPFAITLGLWKKKRSPAERKRGSRFSYSTAENPIAPQNLFPPFMCAVLGWISPLCWLP